MNQEETNKLNVTRAQFQANKESLVNLKLNGRYLVTDEIGKGSFGRIYQAMDLKHEGRKVVVKLLSKWRIRELHTGEKEIEQRLRYVELEDKILKKFTHPNILRCYGSYQNQDFKIIVTQFCNSGDLRQELEKQKCFQLDKAVNVLKQICDAVTAIHQQNIIHRDLKLQNIFIHNGNYIVGDFGLSKVFYSESNNTNCGSSYTQAPEVPSHTYSLKADIYSIGVIFFLMLCSDGSIEQKAMKARMLHLTKPSFQIKNKMNPPSHVIQFLIKTLQPNPEARMSWADLNHSPIFQPQHWSKMPSMLYKYKIGESRCRGSVQSEQIEEGLQIEVEKVAPVELEMLKKTVGEDLETQTYNKMKLFHLSAKIAEFVLDQIITEIEQHGLLDLKTKSNIQLMYLLSARCFIYLSQAYDELTKLQDFRLNQEILNFIKYYIDKTYHKCKAKFLTYSEGLTKYENKMSSRIFEGFQKVVGNKKRQKIFFEGVEKVDYTREEQIRLIKDYLDRIEKLDTKDVELEKRMLVKFKIFSAVTEIRQEQVEVRAFEDIVEEIIENNLEEV